MVNELTLLVVCIAQAIIVLPSSVKGVAQAIKQLEQDLGPRAANAATVIGALWVLVLASPTIAALAIYLQ